MSDIDELNRRLDSIVPGGLKNREGVQFFRQFIQSVKQVIADAIVAQNSADDAQGTANQGVSDAAVAQAVANQVGTDLNSHITVTASASQIGHILQAQAPIAATSTSPGAAPLAFVQAYADAQTNRADDAHARLDDLIAKLQAAGSLQ